MLVSSQYPKANLVACISQVSSLSQVLIKININYKKPNPSPLRKPLPLNPGSSRSNRVEMNEHHSLLSLTTCSQVGRKTNYLSHILLPITMINTPTHKVKPWLLKTLRAGFLNLALLAFQPDWGAGRGGVLCMSNRELVILNVRIWILETVLSQLKLNV